MRTLAITQNTTLDGRVDLLGDWFDPGAQGRADHADLLEESTRQDAACDALLLGRRTFEDFRGYWPQQHHDTTGVTAWLDATEKHVVSSTLTDPQWQHSTVLRGDLVEEVTALKAATGRDIVCTGSAMLTHALLTAGLVDELRLFVYPVVQGAGRTLLPDGATLTGLRARRARTFGCGVTLLHYDLG